MSTWIQTFTGRKFFPLDPRVDDVDIRDIAHALSNVCRYSGHCERFYSVAQHCVIVSRNVPGRAAKWALMHDGPEAYIADLARPVKKAISDYGEIEFGLEAVICAALDCHPTQEVVDIVKRADLAALRTERRDLMKPPPEPWDEIEDVQPWPERILPLMPQQAEAAFLARYQELFG